MSRSSTSEYRIEKIRRRVSIVMAGGTTLEGDLFLQPTARFRAGAQNPADLFNEPDRFVPLAIDGSALTLVAKEQVIRVQYAETPDDTDSEGVAQAAVEVHFTDGSAVGGTLQLETRADRPRLLDFLNGEPEAFLPLRTPAGVCLVNRRQIAQVRHRE